MKSNFHNYLSIYHTNLRNIGLFITIALASYNFTYKTNYMKKIGYTIIPLIFLSISILLNIELLYIVNDNKEYIKREIITLTIIPYLTMILLLIMSIRIFYTY
jgi:hypothetical protein